MDNYYRIDAADDGIEVELIRYFRAFPEGKRFTVDGEPMAAFPFLTTNYDDPCLNDGPEVELCRFFGNFPNGASTAGAENRVKNPIEAFSILFPNLKAPNFPFNRDLEGEPTNG